jgi:hypothetical protein
LSHELTHVIQQSSDATATLQRQPAASGPAATVSQEEATGSQEEKKGELTPIRKKLFELFSKFEKSVVGDEIFNKIETKDHWDKQKKKEADATEKYEEEKKNYPEKVKKWEAEGRIGKKPPPPVPVAKFTTCIATQQAILTEAFKETGLAIKKEGKFAQFALATVGAQTAEAIAPPDVAGSNAWHWGRIGMSERPNPGDIIVMAFRGGTIDQGAKELNYIKNIKYGTAQKLKTDEEAKAKLKASAEASAAAKQKLHELEHDPTARGWQLQEAQRRVERAVVALNAAKKAADKALSAVKNLKEPTAEELAPAEAKLEKARRESAEARAARLEQPVGSKQRYMFQFSHVGFVKEEINKERKDALGREVWKTFDGGQLVERGGKKIEGAQSSTRYYDPKSNEISGEAQQGGEARWLYGWVDVDKMVADK